MDDASWDETPTRWHWRRVGILLLDLTDRSLVASTGGPWPPKYFLVMDHPEPTQTTERGIWQHVQIKCGFVGRDQKLYSTYIAWANCRIVGNPVASCWIHGNLSTAYTIGISSFAVLLR